MSFLASQFLTSSANRFLTLSCEVKKRSSTDAIAWKIMFILGTSSDREQRTKISSSSSETPYPLMIWRSFSPRAPALTLHPLSSSPETISPRSVRT